MNEFKLKINCQVTSIKCNFIHFCDVMPIVIRKLKPNKTIRYWLISKPIAFVKVFLSEISSIPLEISTSLYYNCKKEPYVDSKIREKKMGRKVKLTITESNCRSGFHKKGDEFIIDEDKTICPPMCVELWHYAYPYVWALINGAESDSSTGIKTRSNTVICPDEGRVRLLIEVIDE